MEIDLQVLQSILSLRKVNHLRNLLTTKAKHHFISQKELVSTTKRDIVALANSLNERKAIQNGTVEQLEEKWMWGEQKLFIWILIYYVGSSLFDGYSMTPHEFQKIKELFPSKKPSFLHYEFVLAFNADTHVNSQWTPQEVALLERIYAQEREGDNHWKRISYKLFRESEGGFFKPAQSCRNRWENHSNPQLRKTPWTPQEDLRMLECIMENGTRWATVAKKACSGRNQHMIKNRYRSLIKKLKINEKGKTIEQICLAIIQKAGIKPVKREDHWTSSSEQEFLCPRQENLSPEGESDHPMQKIQEQQADPYFHIVPVHTPQPGLIAKEGLSADEIMQEVYLQEFGQHHRYMSSLDDSWLDRMIESQSSMDALDIFCL